MLSIGICSFFCLIKISFNGGLELMKNYKVNIIYSGEETLEDIFIKVLKKEIDDYMVIICKNNQSGLLNGTYSSLNGRRRMLEF